MSCIEKMNNEICQAHSLEKKEPKKKRKMKQEPLSTTDISFALWNNVASSPLSVPDGVVPSAHRDVHHRPRWLRFPDRLPPFIIASLDQAALDARMLAKRLGLDVREGKRRQFNFIGKLLREVEPKLMDALIEATKDADHCRLRALSVSKVWFGEDDDEGEEDFEQEQEEEECREYSSIASRWFDGLISKDIQMTNEVFSIHTIDFDRQSTVDSKQPAKNEREASIALLRAQKSSTHFLRNLARQLCCSNT
ncbi:hypothetical protein ACJRO7_022788 [Eucalyptus globulus]|uniref:Uncharacterized protein n=1 Tax=Eucalyptus globulus TaxID=34317 RepID=A0ABD3K073_EUCGL